VDPRAARRGTREGPGVKYVAIAGVYAYRYTLGAFFPATCKYHPSCSQYALDAFRCYGVARGAVLTVWRLLRCNPWSHGGVDRVEDQRLFR
jgi:uncharacterized protein